MVRSPLRHVRFGSKADISACPRDVRFAPESGRGLAGAIWAPVTLLTSIGAGRSSRRAARQARAGRLRQRQPYSPQNNPMTAECVCRCSSKNAGVARIDGLRRLFSGVRSPKPKSVCKGYGYRSSARCPLLGVKRTSSESASMSANDSKRTLPIE